MKYNIFVFLLALVLAFGSNPTKSEKEVQPTNKSIVEVSVDYTKEILIF